MPNFVQFVTVQFRAVFKQTIDQERLHKAHRVLINARRVEHVDVQRTDLDVFDAVTPQGGGRLLARPGDAFRTN